MEKKYIILGIVILVIILIIIFLNNPKETFKISQPKTIDINSLSKSQLQQQIININSNLDSYFIDLSTSYYTKTIFLNKEIETKIDHSLKGEINNIKKELSLKGNINTGLNSEQESKDYKIELKDKNLITTLDGQTNSSQLTQQQWENQWNQLNKINQSFEYLKNSNFEIIDDEKVNGIDCYVLKITPNITKIIPSEIQDYGSMIQQQTNLFDEKTYYSKLWLDKKTLEIKKGKTHTNLDSKSFVIKFDIEYIIS